MKKPVALSIAGLDTGNGAGSETDIKVYEILGVHGLTAVTAITAQSTQGVKAILPIPKDFLRKELETLFEDFDIKNVKIGMIYNKDQFEVVRDYIKGFTVIVDPVLFAKDGTPLINDIEDYKRLILPMSTVLTPNAVEASYLSETRISNLEDAKNAAKLISDKFGIPYVIVKGGHIEGEFSTDVLYDSNKESYYLIGFRRVKNKNTHGTGSVFATVISAELAKGNSILSAFRKAREILNESIIHGLDIGKGIGPIDPVHSLIKKSEKFEVLEEMRRFAEEVERLENMYKLIPEVQSNLANSINPNYVEGLEDIAVFRDRITRNWDNKVKVGLPAVFGKPTHTARLLFAIQSYEKRAKNLMNIRYDKRIIKLLSEIGYECIEVNRELEPQSYIEGKSMHWLASFVYENYGKIPNVIYDEGVKGKEAMIRIWTSDIDELIDVLKYLTSNL
ncbi:MAG: bifunctional hydroxymethylpyrimidine kinase/phosphomethylpyrimidine kinase [Sulfolobus sp.]|jgi:hydroxymethylpyrimidine/phosphomethylpyrimidine kinase